MGSSLLLDCLSELWQFIDSDFSPDTREPAVIKKIKEPPNTDELPFVWLT
jgi:hypothetical protein